MWKDAWSEYGIRMGDGFADALHAPLTPKDVVENESRNQHGRRVMFNTDKVRMAAREVTLTFRIHGENRAEMQVLRNRFQNEMLYRLSVAVKMPKFDNGNDATDSDIIYYLRYLGKSVSYGESLGGTSSFITAKFAEDNPMERGVESGN